MDNDQMQIPLTQPRLFLTEGTTSGIAELFPSIWSAIEDLGSSSTILRRQALERLEHTNAARISPLVTYLLATRLCDPDLEIRWRVIKLLGFVLAPDASGNVAPESVINHLTFYLANMRMRQIYAIVQTLASNPDLLVHIIRIFSICPFASNHLVELASSRKVQLDIRRHAIWLIGEVGYLDAIPALERLQIRMESRLNGQQAMPFAPPVGIDDSELLPDVISTLALLRTP